MRSQDDKGAPLHLERIDAPELLEVARRAYADGLRRRLGVLIAQRDAALSRAQTARAACETAILDARRKQRDALGQEAEAAAAWARAAALCQSADAAFAEAKDVQTRLESLGASLVRGTRAPAEDLT